MILPRLMVITDRNLMEPDFESALQAAIRGGARLIQWREKDLPSEGVLPLARAAREICERNGAKLLVNFDFELAQKIYACGVHLPESQSVENARLQLQREYLVGQSVHSIEAAKTAENAGADYLVFGSVFQTDSHKGSTPSGLESLRKVASEVSIPVFAIGGISVSNARSCLDAGAHGVAMIRAIWSAPNVEFATRELLERIKS